MPADEECKLRSPVFRSLQAGRGLAALGVVLFHCGELFGLSKYWNWQHYPFLFGSSGVDFFFVLSGIVILHAHLADIDRPARVGRYLRKRFRRIFPIYWIVLFALLPVYPLVPHFGYGFESQPRTIFDAVVLLPIFSQDQILPVVWTLEHEVLFYLVFAFALLSRRWGSIVLGLWFVASAVLLVVPIPGDWAGFWFSPLHLMFAMGMLGRILWERLNWNGTPLAAVGAMGFAACAADAILFQTRPMWLALLYGLSAMLICLGCMLLEKHKPMRIPRWLLLLGDASYSIYLVHYAVLSVSAKVIYRVWSKHTTPLAIPFVFLLATAVGAGVLVHVVVEAPLMRWMSARSASTAPHASQA